MTLVLQCAVCGTSHPVGTPACTTCRATGVQNLRLLFECPACYRLGLLPTCEACNPPPLPYELVEEADGSDDVLPYEVVEDPDDPFDLGPVDEELRLDDEDDFDLSIDLE